MPGIILFSVILVLLQSQMTALFADGNSRIGVILWILTAGSYYFLILRERKSDKFYDSNQARIKCSMLTEAVFLLISVLISLLSDFYNPTEESEHHDIPLEIFLITLYLIYLIFAPFLSGCLFRLIFVKLPKAISDRIKAKLKSVK